MTYQNESTNIKPRLNANSDIFEEIIANLNLLESKIEEFEQLLHLVQSLKEFLPAEEFHDFQNTYKKAHDEYAKLYSQIAAINLKSQALDLAQLYMEILSKIIFQVDILIDAAQAQMSEINKTLELLQLLKDYMKDIMTTTGRFININRDKTTSFQLHAIQYRKLMCKVNGLEMRIRPKQIPNRPEVTSSKLRTFIQSIDNLPPSNQFDKLAALQTNPTHDDPQLLPAEHAELEVYIQYLEELQAHEHLKSLEKINNPQAFKQEIENIRSEFNDIVHAILDDPKIIDSDSSGDVRVQSVVKAKIK